jgi:hypothetical protein
MIDRRKGDVRPAEIEPCLNLIGHTRDPGRPGAGRCRRAGALASSCSAKEKVAAAVAETLAKQAESLAGRAGVTRQSTVNFVCLWVCLLREK